MRLTSTRSLRSFAALLSLCAVPLLVGCPGEEDETETAADAGQVAPDAGQLPDAGETADAGTTTDAGTPVEPGPGELGGACATGDTCTAGECQALADGWGSRCTTECIGNDECPENLRCEVLSDYMSYCLPGERGTGGLGAACTGNGLEDCASGLCIGAEPEKGFDHDICSIICDNSDDCAFPLPVCVTVFGTSMCSPLSVGELGVPCDNNGACFEDTGSTCTDLAGIGERCTKTCTVTSDCGADYLECRDFSGTWYCVLSGS